MSDLLQLPLYGVTVLSFEQFGAGPWATMQLADLGADVIKVEDPAHGGDIGRTVPPYRAGDTSLFFEAFNRGKRSINLNLRTEAGRHALHELAPHLDVVFSNLRGDQAARLGLLYEDLKEANPAIVCCSLSGFGNTGPRAAEGTYDYVIQALAGWMDLTGEPDAPPTKTGLSVVDFSAGYVATMAVLAGLLRAARTGVGCDCDISLFETALSLLNYVGTWTASRPEYEARRTAHSSHQSIVPFQAFPTADGWIVIACPKEKFWRALCTAIGRPELLEDARFAGFVGRQEHREAVLAELYRTLAERPTGVWIPLLEAAGVPCGAVNDVRAALADRQTVAREIVQTIQHPDLGQVSHVASPLRLTGGVRPVAPAPRQGEHTAEVLGELAGLSEEQIAEVANALRAATT